MVQKELIGQKKLLNFCSILTYVFKLKGGHEVIPWVKKPMFAWIYFFGSMTHDDATY
jgi:hypothetical protein